MECLIQEEITSQVYNDMDKYVYSVENKVLIIPIHIIKLYVDL